jgi:endoglucanase
MSDTRSSTLRGLARLAAAAPMLLLCTGGCAAQYARAAAPSFYADPNSEAAAWVRKHPDDPRAAAIESKIVDRPAAHWFGHGRSDISDAVSRYVTAAADKGQLPILVAYDMPLRDCGQYSKGGAGSADAYRRWIADFAAGIGAGQAVVILEPDALAQLDCLPAQARSERMDLLRYAAARFKAKAPHARVYLDAGHSGWMSAPVAAQRLMDAGVADIQGFSLNVSNFKTTAQSTAYGRAIAGLLAKNGLSKTFVVDTSRNGNGPLASPWCDPPGRRLGEPSLMRTDGDQPEMSLWIKNPGVADGCAAPAGTFVPALAFGLIQGK